VPQPDPGRARAQVVKGNSNVVSAQQGTDVLNGQTAGHGNGYVGSYNGNSNENNQQYVTGNGNSVVGTLYAPATGVRAALVCPAAGSRTSRTSRAWRRAGQVKLTPRCRPRRSLELAALSARQLSSSLHVSGRAPPCRGDAGAPGRGCWPRRRAQTQGRCLTGLPRAQKTAALAGYVPASANLPLQGGVNSPVVPNPSYVPPPKTAANNTDNNNNNNYQRVTGDNNIVVGKEVNTTVAKARALPPRPGARARLAPARPPASPLASARQAGRGP
jgi:hypothetical protein